MAASRSRSRLRLRSPEGSRKPPNLLLLITDQQRSPQHWPEDPAWLRSLMPSDHELARTGLTFNQGFCATCMCTPSRATLLTGTWPSRHGLTLTLTEADLEPNPRNAPYVLADAAAMARGGVPRKRLLRSLAPRRHPRPAGRGRADALDRAADDRQPPPRRRLQRRLQGQVAPDEGDPGRVERGRHRAARPRLRLRRLGPARRRRERRGRALRRRQRRLLGPGLGRGLHASGRELARPRRAAGAVLPDRLARQPARRARLPGLLHRGRLLARGDPRHGRAAAADRRRGPLRQAGGPPADADGDDRLSRAAAQRAREARLRQLLRLPAQRHRREDRAGAEGARRRLRSRLAALADGDRALRRPRRDGPLARRPAPEGVQRLRGDDPGAARDQQPGALPRAAGDGRARLADRRRADDAGARRRPSADGRCRARS